MIISRKNNIIKIRTKDACVSIEPNELKIDDFVIKNPGEYETRGVFIESINQDIHIITLEQTRIGFINKDKLKSKELEVIGSLDILITQNKEIINELEPRLAILQKDIDKILIKKKDLPKEGVKIWKS